MRKPSGSVRREAPVSGQAVSPDMSAVQEFTVALTNWKSTVGYLMAQYLGQRARAGKLSTLFMLAEPLILILVLYLIRAVFRGALADYGTSTLLFYVTGLFPYFFFVRTSTLSRGAMNPRQPLPRIRSMDVFMAQVGANTLIWLVVLLGLHLGMWIYGIEQARPESVSTCATALFLLLMVAVGIGLLNSAIARFFPFWVTMYGILTRGLLFFSGVLHIADFYPLWLREWLVWNPILHGITWFRLGVYGRYPDYVLDEFYLVKCAIVLLFLGFVADRASLRYGGR